jgi:hypothetical protein
MSNVVEGEPRDSQEWHGFYLDEDGIVADVVRRVSSDPVGLKHWLDPVSWSIPQGWLSARRMPFSKNAEEKDPEHAGCLMFAGMSIRNFYGLWHADNPHTAFGIEDDVMIEDGIVTDPRHPNNFSGRVIARVKAELKKLVPEPA